MRRFAITAALLLCLLPGCKEVPALAIHPIGAPDTAIADPSLAGYWRVEPIVDEDDATVEQPDTTAEPDRPKREPLPVFLRVALDDTTYRISLTRGRHVEHFEGELYEVGDDRIFSARQVDRFVSGDAADSYRPAMALFRVDQSDEGMMLSFLKESWVAGLRKTGNLPVSHTLIQGTPVLVAETDALRTFVQNIANAGTDRTEAWQPLGSALVAAQE